MCIYNASMKNKITIIPSIVITIGLALAFLLTVRINPPEAAAFDQAKLLAVRCQAEPVCHLLERFSSRGSALGADDRLIPAYAVLNSQTFGRLAPAARPALSGRGGLLKRGPLFGRLTFGSPAKKQGGGSFSGPGLGYIQKGLNQQSFNEYRQAVLAKFDAPDRYFTQRPQLAVLCPPLDFRVLIVDRLMAFNLWQSSLPPDSAFHISLPQERRGRLTLT